MSQTRSEAASGPRRRGGSDGLRGSCVVVNARRKPERGKQDWPHAEASADGDFENLFLMRRTESR